MGLKKKKSKPHITLDLQILIDKIHLKPQINPDGTFEDVFQSNKMLELFNTPVPRCGGIWQCAAFLHQILYCVYLVPHFFFFAI